MATPAQIAANRRNALRSTGPKSSAGRAGSSRNAAKHGLSAEVSVQEVAAEYRRLTGNGLQEDVAAIDVGALRMAKAEIRLKRARAYERSVLLSGDDALRLLPELDMVQDVLEDEAVFNGGITRNTLIEAIKLQGSLKRSGSQQVRASYARAKRYLREAELEHERAMAAWRPT